MPTDADIKASVLKLISLAGPEAGFLTVFIGLLWPTDAGDPWDKIKERTEQLINAKLDQDAYQRLKQQLAGLREVLRKYSRTMQENNANAKYTEYVVTRDLFIAAMPSFQELTHARILLPLFMQCANLHLLMMKHAYKSHPEKNGFDAQKITDLKTDLDSAVDKYIAYAQSVLAQGPNIKAIDPCNLYTRQITIDVSDYMTLWPYLKADAPVPPASVLSREVYSEKTGQNIPVAADHGPLVPFGQKLTRLQVWARGGDYGPGRQPGLPGAVVQWWGAMDTNKDGLWLGRGDGKATDDEGRTCDIDLTKTQITSAQIQYLRSAGDAGDQGWGDTVTGLQFTLSDGSTKAFAGNPSDPSKTLRVPDDHYLSSVNVFPSDLVRCIFFGFKFKPEIFQ